MIWSRSLSWMHCVGKPFVCKLSENAYFSLIDSLSSSHAPVPKVLRVHVSKPFPLSTLSLPLIHRARKDILLPLLTPIKGIDGREMDSILVPKNTEIFIAILNANRDPLLWGPDSLEWKPERWLVPTPEALHEAHMPGIYSHLSVYAVSSAENELILSFSLTFLGGGRACIGFKFSQLEMSEYFPS